MNIQDDEIHQKTTLYAKVKYWKYFSFGVIIGVSVLLINFLYFDVGLMSRWSANTLFFSMIFVVAFVGPFAKKNAVKMDGLIWNEFKVKKREFFDVWVLARNSMIEETRGAAIIYYRLQMTMALVLGYFLVATVVMVVSLFYGDK